MPLTIKYTQQHLSDYLSRHDPTAQMERFEGLSGRLKGWVLSLFDYTLRIHDEKKNEYFYVRTKDIIRQLCVIPGAPIWMTIDSSSDKIQRLVLENLNPVIGEDVTLEKVSRFFLEFRSSKFLQQLKRSKDDLEAADHAMSRLEDFKNRHLTVLPYTAEGMISCLKPGDIIFKKPDTDKKLIPIALKFFAPFISGKKERQGHQFSHVLIYIGNGKMAEAVDTAPRKIQVRIFDIREPKFGVLPSTNKEYLVSRFNDPKLADQAAQIAAEIAKDDTIQDPHVKAFKYDRFLAVQSVFHTPRFGPFARFRYLKQYIDDHEHEAPKDFMKLKGFICSYFVGYCYQTAESRTVIPKILPENDVPAQGCSPVDMAIRRGLWARIRRWQFWDKMSEHIKFSFDAKRTTPHELRNFIVTKPDLFQDLYLFKAPH